MNEHDDLPPLLAALPDPLNMEPKALSAWLEKQSRLLRKTVFSAEAQKHFQSFVWKKKIVHPLGPESLPTWRRLFLATLLADWACYDTPGSRVDAPRLQFVLSRAWPFLRLFFCPLPDGTPMPVGYSLAYPITKLTYDTVFHNPRAAEDRGVFLPTPPGAKEDIRYLYAFNMSIVESLRNTAASRKLLHAFRKDVKPYDLKGILAVTVDKAGDRIADLGGLSRLGTVCQGPEKQTLFMIRL